MPNYWPSLLLSVAILFGVAICFRQLDYMAMNEVKALISVVFGFATSCLLLSFIWIIQRRPAASAWNMHGSVDVPSMDPEGRPVVEPLEDRPPTVSTVCSNFDQPPDYEDALINSKPVNWHYSDPAKQISDHFHGPHYPCSSANDQHLIHEHIVISLCQRHSSELRNMTISHSISSTSDCCVCLNDSSISNIDNKHPARKSSVAQLALSIVRGFTAIDTNALNQHVGRSRTRREGHLDENQGNSSSGTDDRKISFCQLDVSRLMFAGSPPKYHELTSLSNLAATEVSQSGNKSDDGG